MKKLFLNALFVVTLIFGFSNCEKLEINQPNNRAQWTNCEGRWNAAASQDEDPCTGNGCCCLKEVIIKPSAIADDLINNGGGLDGIGTLLDIAKNEEAKELFSSLNVEQLELIQSGNYIITPLIIEPELYEARKEGRVKFFAAEKSILNDPKATLEDYDFNFGIDIRK